MKLLAIDTATEACSVALLTDDGIHERYQVAPQEHAKLLLPMLDEVLQEAGLQLTDLDGLAWAHGPGSFTGVRIAAATIQGIALACELPVVGVSTLEALAHRAWRETGARQLLAAIDARMDEVYFAGYEMHAEGELQMRIEPCVSGPGEVAIPEAGGWAGVGSGWTACDGALQARCAPLLDAVDADLLPHATDVALLAAVKFANGQGGPAESAIPVYLRDKVAESEAERAASKKS
ncbi:MAG: tRNA (adenosine(37)-N6)-threonylcarbamoyltransferase complex dimerization subunit type 1 TsaB [Gammaproteobacteria bacterium]|nr:tRNA (adenosine(37)-N6)-threonylcarbamoyltransferase complex dimerization subunit type 1 TsaB [Gammaproteobacteria bacterium]